MQTDFPNAMTQWVVKTAQVFVVGESPSFVQMIRAAGLRGVIPDHRKIKSIALEKKAEIDAWISFVLTKRCFSATSDIYKCVDGKSMCSITVHFCLDHELFSLLADVSQTYCRSSRIEINFTKNEKNMCRHS